MSVLSKAFKELGNDLVKFGNVVVNEAKAKLNELKPKRIVSVKGVLYPDYSEEAFAKSLNNPIVVDDVLTSQLAGLKVSNKDRLEIANLFAGLYIAGMKVKLNSDAFFLAHSYAMDVYIDGGNELLKHHCVFVITLEGENE